MEHRSIIQIQIRDYDRRIFEKSWEWLNDPQIKHLTVTPDLDKESLERWFATLNVRKDYYIAGAWRDDEPIGVLGIRHITASDGELFGFIGEKKYWGKAVAVDMMKYTLDYARKLGLSSIYTLIIKENINSIKLNHRLGFVYEKDIDEQMIQMRYYFQ